MVGKFSIGELVQKDSLTGVLGAPSARHSVVSHQPSHVSRLPKPDDKASSACPYHEGQVVPVLQRAQVRKLIAAEFCWQPIGEVGSPSIARGLIDFLEAVEGAVPRLLSANQVRLRKADIEKSISTGKASSPEIRLYLAMRLLPGVAVHCIRLGESAEVIRSLALERGHIDKRSLPMSALRIWYSTEEKDLKVAEEFMRELKVRLVSKHYGNTERHRKQLADSNWESQKAMLMALLGSHPRLRVVTLDFAVHSRNGSNMPVTKFRGPLLAAIRGGSRLRSAMAGYCWHASYHPVLGGYLRLYFFLVALEPGGRQKFISRVGRVWARVSDGNGFLVEGMVSSNQIVRSANGILGKDNPASISRVQNALHFEAMKDCEFRLNLPKGRRTFGHTESPVSRSPKKPVRASIAERSRSIESMKSTNAGEQRRLISPVLAGRPDLRAALTYLPSAKPA